jgi:hypothetical protein
MDTRGHFQSGVIRIPLALLMVAAIAGCGSLHGGAGAVTSATPTGSSGDWAPPGQAVVGSIPASLINSMGMAYYPAPPDAKPAISQAQAEQIALGGPPIVSPLKVRATYLVENLGKSTLSGATPGNRSLTWVVDMSPDQPFPQIGGGQPASPQTSPAPTPQPNRWLWATVNAETGAFDTWFGG